MHADPFISCCQSKEHSEPSRRRVRYIRLVKANMAALRGFPPVNTVPRLPRSCLLLSGGSLYKYLFIAGSRRSLTFLGLASILWGKVGRVTPISCNEPMEGDPF